MLHAPCSCRPVGRRTWQYSQQVTSAASRRPRFSAPTSLARDVPAGTQNSSKWIDCNPSKRTGYFAKKRTCFLLHARWSTEPDEKCLGQLADQGPQHSHTTTQCFCMHCTSGPEHAERARTNRQGPWNWKITDPVLPKASVKLNGFGTSSVLHLWRVGSKCLGCVLLTMQTFEKNAGQQGTDQGRKCE